MNETNKLLAALALATMVYTNTMVTTNWVSTGDSQRINGTNYVEQWVSDIISTDYQEQVRPVVSFVTNRVTIKISREVFSKTNTVVRMNPSGLPPLPPTPGVPTKL